METKPLFIKLKHNDNISLSDLSDGRCPTLFTLNHVVNVEVLKNLYQNPDFHDQLSKIMIYGYYFPDLKDVNFEAVIQPLIPFSNTLAWQLPVKQSDDAMAEFLSCLYVLSYKLTYPQMLNFATTLLRLNMFPPAVCALSRLLMNRSHKFNPFEKALIATEFRLLFENMEPEKKDDIFSMSSVLLSRLLNFSNGDTTLLKSSTIHLVCSKSFSSLKDPVELVPIVKQEKDEDGKDKKDRKFLERNMVTKDDKVMEAVDLILFIRSCGSFPSLIDFTLVQKDPKEPPLSLSDLSVDLKTVMRNSILRLIPPLSLKASQTPVLTKSLDLKVVVCSSRHGDKSDDNAAHSIRLLNLLNGTEYGEDPHKLAKKLCDQGIDLGSFDERKCEEMISILLDCSTSMNDEAFASDQEDDRNIYQPKKLPDTVTIANIVEGIKKLPQFDNIMEHLQSNFSQVNKIFSIKFFSYLLYGHQNCIEHHLGSHKMEEVIKLLMDDSPHDVNVYDASFYCPISMSLMKDPVMTVDGQTYDRPSIETWFQKGHNTSPLTGKPLKSKDLIPNIVLRNLIQSSSGSKPLSKISVEDEEINLKVDFVEFQQEDQYPDFTKHWRKINLTIYEKTMVNAPLFSGELNFDPSLTVSQMVTIFTQKHENLDLLLNKSESIVTFLDKEYYKGIPNVVTKRDENIILVLNIDSAEIVKRVSPIFVKEAVKQNDNYERRFSFHGREPLVFWTPKKLFTTLEYAAVFFDVYKNDGESFEDFLARIKPVNSTWLSMYNLKGFEKNGGETDSLTTFIVNVKTLAGESYQVNVTRDTTIGKLKYLITGQNPQLSPSQMKLIYAGKQLIDNDETLYYYEIGSESCVHLVLSSPANFNETGKEPERKKKVIDVGKKDPKTMVLDTVISFSLNDKESKKIGSVLKQVISKEKIAFPFHERDCQVYDHNRKIVTKQLLGKVEPVSICSLKNGKVVTTTSIFLNVFYYPPISLEIGYLTYDIHVNDTNFDVRFFNLDKNSILDRSLWSHMRNAGDGNRVGKILDENDTIYRSVAHLSQDARDSFFMLNRKNVKEFEAIWDHQNKKQERVLSRLTVAQQCFETFLDKTAAFDYPHRVSLYTFSSKVDHLVPMTSLFDNFRESMSSIEAKGDTLMFDCIKKAALDMIEYRKTNANQLTQDCKTRIIVLTDGVDCGSLTNSDKLVDFLRDNNIVMDAICVSPDNDITHLVRSVYGTGGCAFHPKSTQDQLQIIELEVFLKLGERLYDVPENWEFRAHHAKYADFSGHKKPKRIGELFDLPVTRDPLKNVPNLRGPKAAMMRLMNEFQSVIEQNHPNYQCFVVDNDMTKWRVIMVAPKSNNKKEEDSPYKGGVFVVNVKFGADYPDSPPEVRFETPILHVNCNPYGKVCHDILGRGYDRDQSMIQILNSVYGLLLVQEVNSPFDSNLATLFHENYNLYLAKIREHVKQYASKSLRVVLNLVQQGKQIY